MYKHHLKVYDEYLAKAQALPQNTTADGNGALLRVKGAMGGVAATAQINTALTLAAGKQLSVKLYQDPGETGVFEYLADLCTASGANANLSNVGHILGQYVFPETLAGPVKATLTTDDGSAAGKLDIFLEYLAR